MVGRIIDILLLIAFLSFLPYTRYALYERILFLSLGYGAYLAVHTGRLLEPVVDLLKVDIQSKLVSGMIFLSTIAPRIGQFIVSHQFRLRQIRCIFNRRVGNEMVEFRQSLRLMFVREIDLEESVPRRAELLSDIKRTRSDIAKRHSIGEILIGVVGSTIALLISLTSVYGGIAVLVSVYVIILPLSMSLRSVVIDTLAFSGELVDAENEEILYKQSWRVETLVFQQGWNRMLRSNEAVIHKIILVSFLRDEFVIGSDIAEDIIEEVIGGEIKPEEALNSTIDDFLGEKSAEASLFRWIFSRFIGLDLLSEKSEN
jgi:hypothetical protein